jgi:hypothetical protein
MITGTLRFPAVCTAKLADEGRNVKGRVLYYSMENNL